MCRHLLTWSKPLSDPGTARPALRTLDQLASDKLARIVVDSAIAAVITMDAHGIVTGWGARAASTFGWPSSSAVGQPLADLIVPAHYRDAHNAGLERYRLTRGGPVLGSIIEVSALRRDGTEFPVELRISPAAELDGETVFIAYVLDISERRKREDEVREALGAAQESRAAMDAFVSMIVHELRQPLGVAQGYADLVLTQGGLTATAERQVDQILRATMSALHLVDDILLAARIAAGGLQPEITCVDVMGAVDAAVERARVTAATRSGTIEVSPSFLQPLTVAADEVWVGRILDNILGNAIKYSPDAPRVSISVAGAEAIEVTVADKGKGIPEGMRQRIFERFVRVEDRSSTPGSGLGLFVSRELAQLQRGELHLVSTSLGFGSVFRLRLPRHQV